MKVFFIGFVFLVSLSFAQTTPDLITQETFMGLSEKVLTYLAMAISAGISVLLGVLAAKKAWNFMREYL